MTDELILVPKKKWEYACECRETVQKVKERIKDNTQFHICKIGFPDKPSTKRCLVCLLNKELERVLVVKKEPVRTDGDREVGRFY